MSANVDVVRHGVESRPRVFLPWFLREVLLAGRVRHSGGGRGSQQTSKFCLHSKRVAWRPRILERAELRTREHADGVLVYAAAHAELDRDGLLC